MPTHTSLGSGECSGAAGGPVAAGRGGEAGPECPAGSSEQDGGV